MSELIPSRKLVQELQGGKRFPEIEKHLPLENFFSKNLGIFIEKISEYQRLKPDLSKTIIAPSILQELAVKFHARSGTLTDTIKESIDRLSDRQIPRIRIAHQPNTFMSARVKKQFTHLNLVGQEFQKNLNKVPCLIYLAVDYDEAGDKRFRVAERFGFKQNFVAKDSRTKVMWKMEKPSREKIKTWLKGVNQKDKTFDEAEIWKAYERANTLVEFNLFYLSRLFILKQNMPIVFITGHEVLPLMHGAIDLLLSQALEIGQFETTAVNLLRKNNVDLDYKQIPEHVFPFWYLCNNCDRRVRLTYELKTKVGLVVHGKCICHSEYLVNLGKPDKPITKNYSSGLIPRVLYDDLLDTFAYDFDGGINYIGSSPHMLVSNFVLNRILLEQYGFSKLPPHLFVGFKQGES